MAEAIDSLVLEHLRHIRSKVDVMAEDVSAVKLRMSAMERHMSGQFINEFGQNEELDSLKRRVDRIERRLELVDG